MDNDGIMNGHSVLKTICGTVQWAARQASNPAFRDIAFDQAKGTFRVTVDLPTPEDETYEITACRVNGEQLTPREKLVKVAAGFADLTALQTKQRDTSAIMLRACIARIKSSDSRKRREGIDGLEGLADLFEGKSA